MPAAPQSMGWILSPLTTKPLFQGNRIIVTAVCNFSSKLDTAARMFVRGRETDIDPVWDFERRRKIIMLSWLPIP